MKDFEIIEHTADVGIRAFGRNLAECFENAAKGMFYLITDGSEISSIGQYNIKLKAENLEQLLVDWLSELLFLQSAHNLVFGRFEVELDEQSAALSAKVFGEEYNRRKHRYGVEIKAVTYHMLKVKREPPYEVQVLFDI
ncbi:MAG TPA: archease [Thermoplasmatales archaeon]|nr:archease [Thermoplasmatales archaeon]